MGVAGTTPYAQEELAGTGGVGDGVGDGAGGLV